MKKVRSRDGTEIAFEKSGAGHALILVGGALSNRAVALPLLRLLSPSFSVIAYDRRGRGDSGDADSYAVECEIDDLHALIAEAGGTAFIYGHSSGGALALEGARRGLGISRLALYEPPFIVDETRPPVGDDFPDRITKLLASGRRGEAVELFMTEAVLVPPGVVAGMKASPMWPGLEGLADTLLYDLSVMGRDMGGRPPAKGRWASVTMPTLVMDGGASPPWARNSVEALAAALPNARRLTLEGQNHGATPEALAPVLESFFLAS